MSSTLTISHLNVYAMNPQAMRAIRLVTAGVDADSCGLNEGSRFVTRLPTMRKYRTLVNTSGRDRRRGGRDVPILTRRQLPSLGELTLQISEQVEPQRFGPDRWLSCSMFTHEIGRIAHVNLHPNATVVDNARPRSADVPIVREYVESMESLRNVLAFLADEGFARVVTGDVNYARQVAPVSWSPYEVLHTAGMRTRNAGPNDLLAYDAKLLRLSRFRKLSKAVTHSDHVGLVAQLSAR